MATGRSLQAAYSVQEFNAETMGLKYSQGDRRRLLDAPAPATRPGAYGAVALPGEMCILNQSRVPGLF